MRQLIWKEWHEQGWKLILGCIVVCTFAAVGLRARIIADDEMVAWVCLPFATLLPLFAATGLIPSDRSDGSFGTLHSLPISLGKIMLVEATAGVLLSILPLVGALAVSTAIAGGREMTTYRMTEIYGRSMLTAAMLFIWLFAATIRLPSEARAAMVAIGVVLCWVMLSVGIEAAELEALSTVSPYSFLFNLPPVEQYRFPQRLPPGLFSNLAMEIGIAVVLWVLARCAIGRNTSQGE